MNFPGWTTDDFEIFEIPGFEERMTLIKTAVRPKLRALSLDVAAYLGRTALEWNHHIASHLRRRTNPPDETWAAFGRDRRGYKKYAHLMTGIGRDGAFARLVVKADAEDYKNLRASLLRPAKIEEAIAAVDDQAAVAGYKILRQERKSWVPLTSHETAAQWAMGDDFAIGRFFDLSESEDGETFVRKVSVTFDALMPLYEMGIGMQKGSVD